MLAMRLTISINCIQSSSLMPLTDETATLLARVAELKEQNWNLEEKVD
jgi:hypothetical protein